MSDRSFGTVANEGVFRLRLRRVLPDQDRAVRLLLAIKLARLRQAHRAQVLGRMPGRHLPGGNDVHQRPDALLIGLLARPAHKSLPPACHGSRRVRFTDAPHHEDLILRRREAPSRRMAASHSTTFGTRKKQSSLAGAFFTMSSAMPP